MKINVTDKKELISKSKAGTISISKSTELLIKKLSVAQQSIAAHIKENSHKGFLLSISMDPIARLLPMAASLQAQVKKSLLQENGSSFKKSDIFNMEVLDGVLYKYTSSGIRVWGQLAFDPKSDTHESLFGPEKAVKETNNFEARYRNKAGSIRNVVRTDIKLLLGLTPAKSNKFKSTISIPGTGNSLVELFIWRDDRLAGWDWHWSSAFIKNKYQHLAK